MLHENFEALVANISAQINLLLPEELPTLILTNSGLYIDDKRVERTGMLLSLLTPQPGHTFDVTFDKELQDAFAHNNLEFIKVGEGIAYGLLRKSTVNNDPAVFWIQVTNDADVPHVVEQARSIISDLKKNAGYPQAYNVDQLDIDWNAMNWRQLLALLIDRVDPDHRFRLAGNEQYDFVLSSNAIKYYRETTSKHPMSPVAYLNGVNLFSANDFNESLIHWSIAPSGSNRPVVEVSV